MAPEAETSFKDCGPARRLGHRNYYQVSSFLRTGTLAAGGAHHGLCLKLSRSGLPWTEASPLSRLSAWRCVPKLDCEGCSAVLHDPRCLHRPSIPNTRFAFGSDSAGAMAPVPIHQSCKVHGQVGHRGDVCSNSIRCRRRTICQLDHRACSMDFVGYTFLS